MKLWEIHSSKGSSKGLEEFPHHPSHKGQGACLRTMGFFVVALVGIEMKSRWEDASSRRFTYMATCGWRIQRVWRGSLKFIGDISNRWSKSLGLEVHKMVDMANTSHPWQFASLADHQTLFHDDVHVNTKEGNHYLRTFWCFFAAIAWFTKDFMDIGCDYGGCFVFHGTILFQMLYGCVF